MNLQLSGFETHGSPGGTSVGNQLILRPDAAEMLDQLLLRIRAARQRVWIEIYILDTDRVGDRVVAEMILAAERGCSVVLLLDGWGARKFSGRSRKRLVRAGGKIAFYNPVFRWWRPGRKLGPALHRDHRKILIIDDVAFVGGRNISKDYLGESPFFVDLSLQVEGPAVRHIASLFVEVWLNASGTTIQLPDEVPPFPDGKSVSVLELDQRLGYPDLDLGIQSALEQVKARCSIISPYFVPPDWFLRSLTKAMERGVQVRILTAGKSDVPMAKSAGRHLYARLLELGAEIYEMQGPVLHAKAITFDDELCIVGSYNIDAFGSRHNLEIGVAVASNELVNAIEQGFDHAIERSFAVDRDRWSRRKRWSRLIDSLSNRVYRI